jgi:hypothetical protein
MSWARATVTSVHQRRVEGAGAAGEDGEREGEVCGMEDSIYETN